VGLVDGKSGVVTGGAGGIGRATAVCFGKEGASVVVTDLESQREAGEETVRLIEEAGGRAVFVAADVASDEDQRRLVEECVSAFGRLDFAFNNAGIDVMASLEETTVEDWNRCIAVNLTGVFLGMKHQLARMREQGEGGAIVNTASSAGVLPVPRIAAYVASKFGVVGLTKAAALEAGDAGIRVNCIAPGAVRTPMIEHLPPEWQETLMDPQPIKRLTMPSEVGETVVWLASDRASAISGVAFPVDLGTTAGITRPAKRSST
jgi:NAD(P)-dependent dehydrogenase (short-subunit alcohol dehydrogenase family)